MATVLVIDDRAAYREIARATLDDGGHRVVEAADGRAALSTARSTHPDVVIADVLMPGMDGYEFVHELRNDPDTADIPVLLYTANYRPEEVEPLAAAYGITSILSKTGDPHELLAAVNEALVHHPAPPPHPLDPGLAGRYLHTVNAKLLEKVQALEESQALLATIAELSPIGIVLGDADGLATYVNPHLCELARVPAADLLGTGWQRCLPPEQRGRAADPGAAGASPRRYGPVTFGEGRLRWLSIVVQDLYDTDCARTGFVATVDEVTSLIDAEQRRHAEERQRMIEERQRIADRFDSLARLSGGVAHDFNNLLNIIMSFGEFVEESVTATIGQPLDRAGADAILADLNQITQAGRRAARLTHELLTFGGRQVVQPSVVDINEVVGEVCAMVKGTIGRQVTVTTRLDPAARHVYADSGQLCQVLLNLVHNARDAMPRGGQLSLRTANLTNGPADPRLPHLPPGEYVHVTVADDGDGMPPEVVQRAIEPFFTTKPKGHGTGLGLATAYGIAKQAGGDLMIDSTVGCGTAVHLYLPASGRAIAAVHPPRDAVDAGAGTTILVAEDEDGLREVASRLLVNAGYQVVAASDGEEALATMHSHPGPIHALLTDVVMPRMNGCQLAEAVRKIRPHLPILYMSGHAGALLTEEGILEPGAPVLTKPFTKAELLDALGAALATQSAPAP
jgi:PAS domain S-box-containing protein